AFRSSMIGNASGCCRAGSAEQRRQPDIAALSFEERFALLVDRETTERDNKRLITRLRFASLRQNAVVEDAIPRHPVGSTEHYSRSSSAATGSRHNLLLNGR